MTTMKNDDKDKNNSSNSLTKVRAGELEIVRQESCDDHERPIGRA